MSDDHWQHTTKLLIVWATASLAVVVLMLAGLPGWSHWVFVLLQVPCACYMADRLWWHFKGSQADG